jgi:hypothetical protein
MPLSGIVLRGQCVGLSDGVLVEAAALAANGLVGAQLDEMNDEGVARQGTLYIKGADVGITAGAVADDVRIALALRIHGVTGKNVEIRRFGGGVGAIRDVGFEVISFGCGRRRGGAGQLPGNGTGRRRRTRDTGTLSRSYQADSAEGVAGEIAGQRSGGFAGRVGESEGDCRAR